MPYRAVGQGSAIRAVRTGHSRRMPKRKAAITKGGIASRVPAGCHHMLNGSAANVLFKDPLTGKYVVIQAKVSRRPIEEPRKSPARQSDAYGIPLTRKGAKKSLPSDDPLAPERTRWLSDVVGGGSRLAELLKVSPSQTSRWATGEERPSAHTAPLLIDLEHVLARVRLVWAEPAATTWMASVNAHLAGARPIDVLTMRGVGPVLEALDAGAWGSAA